MDWLRMIGFCLLCAAMVLVIRQMQPQIAGLLTGAFGILLIGMILPEIAAYIEMMMEFLRSLNLDEQYFRILLKTTGIVLVTRVAVQICRDMEAPSVAVHAEFCGRVALLGVAAPIFMELTQTAVGILR